MAQQIPNKVLIIGGIILIIIFYLLNRGGNFFSTSSAPTLFSSYNPSAPNIPGLISYYNFDANSTIISDSIGTNLLINNATWNSTGFIGGAYDFSSSNIYGYMVPSTQMYDINQVKLNGLSFSVWIRPQNSTNSPQGIIGGGCNSCVYFASGGIDLYSINNQLQRDSVRSMIFNGVAYEYTSGTKQINDGQWHFITAVFNSTGNLSSLYIDGFLNNFTSNIGIESIKYQPTIFRIGSGMNINSHTTFNGSIDEVGIWGRALTSDEVFTLYSSYTTTSTTSTTSTTTSTTVPITTTTTTTTSTTVPITTTTTTTTSTTVPPSSGGGGGGGGGGGSYVPPDTTTSTTLPSLSVTDNGMGTTGTTGTTPQPSPINPQMILVVGSIVVFLWLVKSGAIKI